MSECIEHNQKGIGLGYGSMSHKGRTRPMHRIAYCFARGVPIEYIEGAVVRHTCDIARCINPQHLLLGTAQDNVDDRVVRGRCNKGENRPQSVLTQATVTYIRKVYKPRCRVHGQHALARKFSVNQRTIYDVLHSITWQDKPY